MANPNSQSSLMGDSKGRHLLTDQQTNITDAASSTAATLTDNSTGTASQTLAAGAGVTSIAFAVMNFADTGAGSMGATTTGDVVTDYIPGFKFKVLNLDFITDLPGAGSSATAAVAVHIGATPVTDCVCTITEASTDTRGELTSGVVASAANTGSATDTISLNKATSTVFTAGSGYFLLSLQNMDTADAIASLADEVNALLVDLDLSITAVNSVNTALEAHGLTKDS